MNDNNESYTWIPAFRAITDWIVDYENRQEELVDILQDIGIENGLKDQLIKDKPTKSKVMDPFSFLSLIMKYGEERSLVILKNLLTRLDQLEFMPTDLHGLPRSNPQKVWLFPYGYIRQPEQIELLWNIFDQARSFNINESSFNLALEIPNTAFTKLTQSLFYINPNKYLPIDKQTEPWLIKQGIDIPKKSFESYQACLDKVRDKTNNKPFWEISHEAWLENQNNRDGINKVESLKTEYDNSDNSEVKNNTTIPLNRILYGPPGTGKTYQTTELAVQCVASNWYDDLEYEYLDEYKRRALIKNKYDELVEMGRIAFTTFHQSFTYEDFVEGIRPTIVENEANESIISYEVADGVFKQICDSAVAIVKQGTTETVNIDGKTIWKLSLGNTLIDEGDIYDECIDNEYVLLGWGGSIDYTGCENREKIIRKIEEDSEKPLDNKPYNFEVTAVNTFKNMMEIGDLIIVSDGNQKFRAIAEITGDYEFLDTEERHDFQQKRKVNWLRVYNPSLPISRLFDKSLSQMTIYQLKNTTINRDKLKQLLSVESTTQNAKNLPHLLIIDEINRGNISRIFGELITLLEPDKRKSGSDAREVTLPYSKEKFSVPSNLYVLGTMNTADKSLAQLDLALRRRFDFIELLPKPSLLDDITVHDVKVSEILTIINARIEVLLDREHTIGHSYFWALKSLKTEDDKEAELDNIFKKRIIPLLQEYFFSDWERIGWILNDPNKNPVEQFIQTEDLLPKLNELFSSDIEVNDRRYQINEMAFSNPKSYQKILMSKSKTSESMDI